MITLIKDTKIDFLGKRYFAFAVSGVLTLIGLLAVIHVFTGKANLGIDFAGGTAVQLKFERPVSVHDVRTAVEAGGIKEPDIQDFPSVNKVLIRVKGKEEKLGDTSNRIVTALGKGIAGNKFVVDSTTEIGPKVGSRLRNDAFWAVLLATLFILAYIAWRFQFRFGVGATVATFHDVMAVLGIFYLMDKEINLILLSALLTIAGYSLTDTVVVFDRIREEMKRQKKSSLIEIMNLSINEVLSRTIITSWTVLLSSICLFFFGGEVLHDFSLAMILGVLVGTFSSIFVASPIVLALEKKTAAA